MNSPLSIRLLLGRLLTRSGDQAWDFAVPIVLLKLFPDQLRIAALYYLLIRMLSVVCLPRLASVIDEKDRFTVARLGLYLQLAGVLISAASVLILSWLVRSNPILMTPSFFIVFAVLVAGGLLGALGAGLMDISIANDLAPAIFSGESLSRFNSRFRQVDLFTEVCSPIAAGLLLAIRVDSIPLTGFGLVTLWNFLSFFPEFAILSSVFNERPDLKNKAVRASQQLTKGFVRTLIDGWKEFFEQPIAPAMMAYAFLWLSVLSPHGVLMTGFLQDGWKLSESTIGIFRGCGALFGLAATLVFPVCIKFMDVRKASAVFLAFQSLMVLVAFGFFHLGNKLGQIGFLIFVLFSRIGMYGFSLGETQIRQEGIPMASRGRVNGFAGALTGIATLVLFGVGTILPTTNDFKYLVLMSVSCVVIALIIYGAWIIRKPTSPEINPKLGSE